MEFFSSLPWAEFGIVGLTLFVLAMAIYGMIQLITGSQKNQSKSIDFQTRQINLLESGNQREAKIVEIMGMVVESNNYQNQLLANIEKKQSEHHDRIIQEIQDSEGKILARFIILDNRIQTMEDLIREFVKNKVATP